MKGPGDRADWEDRAVFGGLSCKIKVQSAFVMKSFLMITEYLWKTRDLLLSFPFSLRFRGYRITYNLFNSEYPWKWKFILCFVVFDFLKLNFSWLSLQSCGGLFGLWSCVYFSFSFSFVSCRISFFLVMTS